MGKSIAWVAPASVISVAVLTALALDRNVSVVPQAQAQGLSTPEPEALCPRGDATLYGAYMAIGGGTAIGVGPVAFVGKLTYDGKGHVTNPYTVSFAGAIYKLVDNGTYTVNSDCTGTYSSGDGTQHYNFVVNPDGSKVNFIETDAGTVISGTISRMRE